MAATTARDTRSGSLASPISRGLFIIDTKNRNSVRPVPLSNGRGPGNRPPSGIRLPAEDVADLPALSTSSPSRAGWTL